MVFGFLFFFTCGEETREIERERERERGKWGLGLRFWMMKVEEARGVLYGGICEMGLVRKENISWGKIEK